MMEVAKEKLGIDIKKKFGTKPLDKWDSDFRKRALAISAPTLIRVGKVITNEDGRLREKIVLQTK